MDATDGAARHVSDTASPGLPQASIALRQIDHVWVPPADLRDKLHRDFTFAWTELGPIGNRRIVPMNWSLRTCVKATVAGHAIIEHRIETSEQVHAARILYRLLFELGPRLTEHFVVRGYLPEDELRLRGEARIAVASADILPDNFGITSDSSVRWTLSRLYEEGARAARQNGICDPSHAECFSAGILEEAKLNPVDVRRLTAEEIRRRLRLAAFDVGPSPQSVNEELKDRIYSRLMYAIGRHENDDFMEFYQWFFEELSDVVKQIANRKGRDGKIDRIAVRQTILELVFDSWEIVAGLVNVFFRTLRHDIEPKLSDAEFATFELMNCSIPQLGGLPIILLYEYLPLLKEPLLRLLETPNDPQLWGQFHRLLETNATMTFRRRTADRAKKSHRGVRRSRREPVEILPSTLQHECPEELKLLVRDLLVEQNVICQCGNRKSWTPVAPETLLSSGSIELSARCEACGATKQIHTTMQELRRLAAEDAGD